MTSRGQISIVTRLQATHTVQLLVEQKPFLLSDSGHKQTVLLKFPPAESYANIDAAFIHSHEILL